MTIEYARLKDFKDIFDIRRDVATDLEHIICFTDNVFQNLFKFRN